MGPHDLTAFSAAWTIGEAEPSASPLTDQSVWHGQHAREKGSYPEGT